MGIVDYCGGGRELKPCKGLPGCTWLYTARFNQHWLYVDDHPVASLLERTDGTWVTCVNRHREISYLNPTAHVPSVRFGKKMLERWARVHIERLRREIASDPKKDDFVPRKKAPSLHDPSTRRPRHSERNVQE